MVLIISLYNSLLIIFIYTFLIIRQIHGILYSFNVKINDASHINTHCNLHTNQLSGLITTDYNNTTDYYILIILVMLDTSLVFRVMIPNAVNTQFDLLRMSILLLETCRGI